jgi:phenylpyruvate tautomerase PptA (4-oxalocrotonate tautomerase family)
VISEHAHADLLIDPTYFGIDRSEGAIIIQVMLNESRARVEKKKLFFKALVDGLHERLGMRREDVAINLVEVKKENWSLGNGEAQYANNWSSSGPRRRCGLPESGRQAGGDGGIRIAAGAPHAHWLSAIVLRWYPACSSWAAYQSLCRRCDDKPTWTGT